MTEDSSKIVKIVQERIKESVESEKKAIREECARLGDNAVARINGVFASIQHTILELDIKETSMLEFYSKAGGRVRTVEIENSHRDYENKLYMECDGKLLNYQDPIIIKPGKKYKLLLMAIEEGDVK